MFWVFPSETCITLRTFSGSDGALNTHAVINSSALSGLSPSDSLESSTILLNAENILIVHDGGTLNLVSHAKDANVFSAKYSESSGNFVRSAVLTRSYCGAVFKRADGGDSVSNNAYSYRLFRFDSGDPVVSRDGVEAYGRVFFSAGERYFVFSHADALYDQHFAVYDMNERKKGSGPVVVKEFVLTDR